MNEINVLLEPVHALLIQIGAFMPRLAIAVGVLSPAGSSPRPFVTASSRRCARSTSTS